jgi:Family of unknown function (DUF6353)
MNKIAAQVLHQVKVHLPTILSVGAGVGVVTTAYLSGKASWRAANLVKAHEDVHGVLPDRNDRVKERVKLTWRLYAPAAATGAVTVGCIVASNRVSNKRLMAAVSAYALADEAFGKYKEQVVEQLGFRKEEAIRDKVAEKEVARNVSTPVNDPDMTPGNVLMLERHTGRYFYSHVETVRKAQNDLNHKLIREPTVSLDDFYYMVGLKPTQNSDEFGWTSDRMVEIEFSTQLYNGSIPCITFSYENLTLINNSRSRHGICLAE